MTVCAAVGCRDAALRSCASIGAISPRRNVLQGNAASVAEGLPLGRSAFAIGQEVARGEGVAAGFVNKPRGDVNLLRLLRQGVVVDLGHPRQRFGLS